MALDQGSRIETVVIGAGHNGLVAAAALAGQGARVTVLEQADAPGGMMAAGHLIWNLHPAAMEALGTEAQALGLDGPALPTTALDPGGRHVVIEGDDARLAGGEPHPQAAVYRTLCERFRRFAGVLAPLTLGPPPRLGEGWLTGPGLAELRGLGRLGLDIRRLGRREMQEFLRVAYSNVADVLLAEMPDGPLAASLAFDGVLGARMGPRSPGTVLTLLYRHLGGSGRRRPEGGMATLARRMAEAAEARGASIRYGARASGLLIAGDRVLGVGVEGQESIPAHAVFSSLGAGPTLALAGVEHFDAEVCRRVRNLRAEGVTARLDLTLSDMPRIEGLDARHTQGRLLLAPSVAAMEASFDPVKYGRMPDAPAVEALVEPVEGGARLSALIQPVPNAPGGGWSDGARGAAIETVVALIDRALPGLADTVTGAALDTPSDIEARTAAPGGHWHHGEFAVDQMLMLRPVNGMGHYRTGLPGLWLCGAGAHPGGDVTGLPGRNAALAALAEGVRR
ncbi:MAG TPA: NAD(P)/FAD-dependent oxidoreductase [Thermohalobaculum sp.]|nr:NAD(P)/FAD-dependent oxidoreductase [Thermohalobaculum sp.]